jgi:hypothetical protein
LARSVNLERITAMGYLTTKELVANSDAEIFADAFDMDVRELPNYQEDADDDDFGSPEGWDGEPLGDDELVEQAAHGHPDNGFDRPLQLAEDQRHGQEIAGRDELISEYERQIADLRMRADPGRQQRLAQQREEIMHGIIANPEEALRAMGDLHSQNAALIASRVEASMGAAHREHGPEFERAYQNLTSMDPGNQAARNLVQSIYNDRDPGRALMDWHGVSGGHTPRAMGPGTLRGVSLPSLNSATGGGSPTRSSRFSSSGHMDGWGDEDMNAGDERDIFRSAAAR